MPIRHMKKELKMSKPVVAIIGRPNVGKSTLFNAIAGEPISIVKDTPGVTRDRIYADCTWLNMNFTLIDTGGIEPDSSDIILSQMREQAEIAIETADVIVFITDVRQGLVDSDSKVCDMLRKSRKPVVLAVNKVDSMTKFGNDVYEFYNLGIGEPIPVSAASRLGIGDLLEAVASHFKNKDTEDEEDDDRPRIAIVGKPNVGKSSIINRLTGQNRVIVSDIAGTTRDAIDTVVVNNKQEYVFIDTAGLRRKSKVKEDIERYSIIRTVTAVDRADVVILVIDASEGVTEQDAKIAGIARENQTLRIQTGVLNEIISEATVMQQPPSDKGKRLKIFYATQVAVKPPTFVIFVNIKQLMHFSYQRYLENKIREAFGFRGTSIRFIIRERKEDNK